MFIATQVVAMQIMFITKPALKLIHHIVGKITIDYHHYNPESGDPQWSCVTRSYFIIYAELFTSSASSSSMISSKILLHHMSSSHCTSPKDVAFTLNFIIIINFVIIIITSSLLHHISISIIIIITSSYQQFSWCSRQRQLHWGRLPQEA